MGSIRMAPEIEEFAKLLIAHVRDKAVAACDLARSTECNALVAKRWRTRIEDHQSQELAFEIIPDCVDNTLFYLLDAVDRGFLKVSFTAASGQSIDLVEKGESELSGWYMASQGWRLYSKERFSDDFKSLE